MKLRVKQQMLINAVYSTRPGGVLELSTFNYFFAGAFFADVVFLFVINKVVNKEATQANKAHMHQKAVINLPLIQPPLRMETTGLRKSTRQFPMQIIKIGNGAEAAQAMLRLLFLHKKSIH